MRAMRRFRNRKGVFVVLFGILFTVLMAAGAIAIDFSRIWAMRNELQTAADAAALSGAVQLNKPPKNLYFDVDTAARGIASKNLAMGAPTTVDSVVWGQWQDNTTPPHFNPGVVPANAVQAWVSHSTRGLIMQALGITAPTVHANAIAWADAPISTTNCIRPWAIPYEVLMGRVNLLRTDDPSISGAPYTRANLTRPFDPINDMNALRNGDPANLRFTLKLGQNSNANNGSIDEGSLVNGQPGNFQAVALPKYWDFATQSLANPGPNRGGSAYSDAIAGKNCYSIAIGDSLMTETGNKVGPTVSAADKSNNQTAPFGICAVWPRSGVGPPRCPFTPRRPGWLCCVPLSRPRTSAWREGGKRGGCDDQRLVVQGLASGGRAACRGVDPRGSTPVATAGSCGGGVSRLRKVGGRRWWRRLVAGRGDRGSSGRLPGSWLISGPCLSARRGGRSAAG